MASPTVTSLAADLAALTTRVTSLETKLTALTTRTTATEVAATALTTRVTATEAKDIAQDADIVAMRTERSALLVTLNQRLAALETHSTEVFADVAQNVLAIQAILTLLHPDPQHPAVDDTSAPQGAWLHSLVMKWITTYGRLTPS